MKRKLLASMLPLLLSLPLLAADVTSTVSPLLAKGDYAEAAKLLKPLAAAGDAVAQYHLGMLHYNGQGVPEDEKAAVDLLTGSANQGNIDAMFQLGNAFVFGNETPRLVADADQEAARWYFKAASAGHAEAQYALGLLFIVGKGVQRNIEEADRWMQQAAKNGHKEAQNYMSLKKNGR